MQPSGISEEGLGIGYRKTETQRMNLEEGKLATH